MSQNSIKKVLPILFICATLFMGIGYASINSINLDITGTIETKAQDNIYISDVSYKSNNGAITLESVINSYYGTLLNSKISLSKTLNTSSITYTVSIYNNTDETYVYKGILYDDTDSSFYDNNNIIITASNIKVGDELLSKKSITFDITFSYKDNILGENNILNSYISFSFKAKESIVTKQLVNKYVESGNIDDVSKIDFDNMTTTEKQNMFSNVSSGKDIYRVKGITGEDVLVLRGNYTDNYVSFGGYTWRILQIDENGNLRIILDGVISNTTSTYRDSASATSLDNAKTLLLYANSNVKTSLDSFYTNNLSSYSSFIVKSKFCNNFDYVERTSSGTQSSVYYFQSYENIGQDSANYSPDLKCLENYIFEENIGLISAEEAVIAGAAYNKSNSNYFLYNSSITSYFWTLSPAYYDANQQNTNVFVIGSDGTITDWTSNLLNNNYYLRPVITISGEYEMTGTGTSSDPFKYK